MALDAVLVVSDPFLIVFGADLRAGVLVATVAGVVAVVVVDVAGLAGRVVVPVEEEQLVVFEGGRGPGLLAMALAAVTFDYQPIFSG